MITNKKTNRDSKFCFLILFLALAISANTPSLHADIIVDPNTTGATDTTDVFFGNPVDPTAGGVLSNGLAVGFNGDGELLIDNSGGLSAVLSTAGRIAQNAGSTGKVTVSGGAWNAEIAGGSFGDLVVGNGGDGELIINNGGAVFSDRGRIAEQVGSSGTVTVTGTNSLWANSGSLGVGDLGAGQLTVLEGGKVTSTFGGIGDGGGFSLAENNEVLVSGVDALGNASAWEMTGAFAVGNSKPGKLTLEDGGRVTTTVNALVGNSQTHSELLGEVIVRGIHADGTRSLLETGVIGGGGNLEIGSVSRGIMTITDGGRVVTSGAAEVGDAFNGSVGDGQVTVSGVHTNGTASSWELGSRLAVGSDGIGKLTVDGGGQVSSRFGSIGSSGGDGDATVTGDGSAWTMTEHMFVGGDTSSVGKLTVSDGGTVTAGPDVNVGSVNGNGEVVVTGDGSKFEITGGGMLRLGRGTTGTIGTMMVADGGLLTHDGDGILGEEAMGTGEATVTGLGSHWEVTGAGSFLLVGNRGIGKLTVSDQGRVSNRVGEVGVFDGSDGEVTVTGAGSLWDNSSALFVGDAGKGKLTIEAGGEVRYGAATAFIGNSAGSMGEVMVTGAGSVLNGGGLLTLGENSGSGSVSVSDGGQVNVPDVRIGNGDSNAISEISIQGVGARLNISNDLIINGNANGTLAVSNGGRANATDVYVGGNANNGGGDGQLVLSGNSNTQVEIAGDLKLWSTGTVTMQGGTLDVDTFDNTEGGVFDLLGGTLQADRFEGNLVNEGGTVAPGPGLGSMLVVGDFTQEGNGTLAFEIGNNGSHDLINVTGAADLDGLLAMTLVNSFVPEASETITLLIADSLLGIFDNAINSQRLDTTDGTGSFLVNYGIGSAFDNDQIVLSNFEANAFLPGDFDQDGDVDGSDFLNWQRNDGSASGLAAWEAQYGSPGSSPLASSQAVPEPTTAIMLTIAVACIPFRRRLIMSFSN